MNQKAVKPTFTPWRIGIICVFAVAVLLYLPSAAGGAVWDDVDLLSGAAFGKNTLLSAFTHPFLGHYFRPLTSASFVIESSIFHSTPFLYHQTNILLHAFTAVLVCLIAYLVTQKPTAGILAGFFFAAQPMQVGAAAWIGGRTDVLSTFFVAAFMGSLVMYYESQKTSWLITSAFMFLLGAISKEQALALLPAAPLSVFVFGSKKWKEVGKICILYGIAVAIFVGMWMLDAPPPNRAPNSILGTITLALKTTSHYGLAFLAPNRPSLLTWTLENYKGPIWLLVGAIITVACMFAFRFCWKNYRPVAWVAVCGLLVYIPVSNFPTVPSFVLGPYRCAEPGAAIACLYGIGAAWTLTPRRFLLAIPFAANLIAGAYITWIGVHFWTDSFKFFEQVAHTDRHFIVGVGNYAHALTDTDHAEESIKWTDELLTWIFGSKEWRRILVKKKAKAFTPEVIQRLKSNGGNVDYKALGWFVSTESGAFSHLKRVADALELQKDALMISPGDPRSHFGYGQIVLSFDRPEALAHWEYALKLSPKYNACAAALGHEYVIDHRYKDAIRLLEPITTDMGWNSQIWLDLADAKMSIGDFLGAKASLDSSQKAMLIKKEDVDARRKKLQALMDPSKPKVQNQ